MFVDATLSGAQSGATATADVPANAAGDLMFLAPFTSGDVTITSDGFTLAGSSGFLDSGTHSGKTTVLVKELTQEDSGTYELDFGGISTQCVVIAFSLSGRATTDYLTWIDGNTLAGATAPDQVGGISLDGDDLIYMPNEFNGLTNLTATGADFTDQFPSDLFGMHLFYANNISAGDIECNITNGSFDYWYPVALSIKKAGTPPPPTPSFNILNQISSRKRWGRRMKTRGR